PVDEHTVKPTSSKSSTQLLHEKINMLGKSQPTKSAKPVPATTVPVSYPDLPESKPDVFNDRTQGALTSREPTLTQDMFAKTTDAPAPLSTQRPQAARPNTADQVGRRQIGGYSSPT